MRFLGNDKLIDQLHILAAGGRLPQACIIEGPKGSGKRTFSRILAAAAVCTAASPPCGQCEGCLKAEKNIHPDIETVRRETAELKVEQIRALRLSLHVRANEAPRRVALLEEANTLNDAAQNALLKLMEDPPAPVLIVLILENKEDLLPTVRSRCAIFRMNRLSDELLMEELLSSHGFSEEMARKATKRAQGLLGKALAVATELSDSEADTFLQTITRAISEHNSVLLSRAGAQLEKMPREQGLARLDQLRVLLTEALACQMGFGAHQYPVQSELLAQKIYKNKLTRLEQNCRRLIRYGESYVGAGLVSGAFMSLFSEEN